MLLFSPKFISLKYKAVFFPALALRKEYTYQVLSGRIVEYAPKKH
jgi:hypothetical protein